MWQYPKQFKLYREMTSLLDVTSLVKNLELLHKSHLEEIKCIKKGIKPPFLKNLHTAQAIEIFREIIINSWNNNKWLDFYWLREVIWKYTRVKDELDRKRLNKAKKEGWLWILYTISHKQFWYQRIENELLSQLNYTYNYYKLPCFDDYIKKNIWISLERLLIVWFLMSDLAENNLYFDLEKKWQLFEKEIKVIIKEYSIDLFDLKEKLEHESKNSSKFENISDMEYYWLWDIFDRPLIKINWKYICVFPVLLLNRITNAIYHLFDKDFRNKKYWNINENFIFSLFKKLKDFNVIHTEEHLYKYKRNIPNNPDILVEQWNYVLFIECKSNSITYKSIRNWLSDEDRKKIKDNIIQIYKSIIYYINLPDKKEYFWLTKKNNHLLLPIISYVNNPYLGFWRYLWKIIDEIVSENKDITKEIIDNYPLKIISNKDVIDLVNILNSIWLKKFYNLINSNEYFLWEWEPLIKDIYNRKSIDDSIFYDHSFEKLLEMEKEKHENKSKN